MYYILMEKFIFYWYFYTANKKSAYIYKNKLWKGVI